LPSLVLEWANHGGKEAKQQPDFWSNGTIYPERQIVPAGGIVSPL